MTRVATSSGFTSARTSPATIPLATVCNEAAPLVEHFRDPLAQRRVGVVAFHYAICKGAATIGVGTARSNQFDVREQLRERGTVAAMYCEHPVIDTLHEHIESGQCQLFLALEMIVEATLLQSRHSHDLGNRRRLITLPVQQWRGTLEDALTSLFAFTHDADFKTIRSVLASTLSARSNRPSHQHAFQDTPCR